MTDLSPQLVEWLPISVPDRYAAYIADWIAILGDHIRIVETIPIDDTIEPAPIFRP